MTKPIKRYVECITKEEYIYNMLRLEGISVKKESMPFVLRRISTNDVKPSDIPKIDNILKGFSYSITSEHLFSYKEICRINSIVDYGRDDCSEGKLRKEQISITGTHWKPPIPNEMQVKEHIDAIINLSDHIKRAVELMLYLMKAQLFCDGNKRTAQLFSAELLKSHSLVISIPFCIQRDFCNLLIKYYEDENSENEIKDFIYTKAIFERRDF